MGTLWACHGEKGKRGEGTGFDFISYIGHRRMKYDAQRWTALPLPHRPFLTSPSPSSQCHLHCPFPNMLTRIPSTLFCTALLWREKAGGHKLFLFLCLTARDRRGTKHLPRPQTALKQLPEGGVKGDKDLQLGLEKGLEIETITYEMVPRSL